jgi:Holliday junction resolvase RusA-like endonuclease
MITLTIRGPIPAKKNENKITCAGRYPRTYKSKRFINWYEPALEELGYTYKGETIEQTKSIVLRYYLKTKRKKDLTNISESIMDLLVDARVLKDDEYKVVPDVRMVFMAIDKENPRCEVEIEV